MRKTNPADFSREAATVALEASDDSLARARAALEYRRRAALNMITGAQRIRVKRLLHTTAWCAVAGLLLMAMAGCAFMMNVSHGYL